ncbi:MAG TPA: crosslink repair DNA glycosylase YcaQ family protein, partial [Terriglobia bacterium]|nr:crosslink repair DNA glycosylase YcaQ family protein [Terriglobia bacterium]
AALRLRKLILGFVKILAPVPLQTLHANIARYKTLGNPRAALRDLIEEGILEYVTIDGKFYVWLRQQETADELPATVRFLAPFDPVVWDRRRFEHLFGWAYRFEAYTPVAKRVRGYYAMPMLWLDNIIGWANATVADGKLHVDVGFVKQRPRGAEFSRELDREIARLKDFLHILH